MSHTTSSVPRRAWAADIGTSSSFLAVVIGDRNITRMLWAKRKSMHLFRTPALWPLEMNLV